MATKHTPTRTPTTRSTRTTRTRRLRSARNEMTMNDERNLNQRWEALPTGARAALEELWAGVAAGGLPCGSAVIDANGSIVASGRNHAYDTAGGIATRARYPLQHNRLAHAELNALACIPTETDHAPLTLWTTQHPCSMCGAVVALQEFGAGVTSYLSQFRQGVAAHMLRVGRSVSVRSARRPDAGDHASPPGSGAGSFPTTTVQGRASQRVTSPLVT